MLHFNLMSPQKLKNLSLAESLEKEKFKNSLSFTESLETNSSNAKEEYVIQSIISDNITATMTALMAGSKLKHKVVSEKMVRDISLAYSTHPSSFERALSMKIITLQYTGSTWDSQKSSKLRSDFRDKEETYLDKLQRINPLNLQDYRIFASSLVNIEKIEEPFLGVWAAAIRKHKSRIRGSNVSLLLREFKDTGKLLFALVKFNGKKGRNTPHNTDEILSIVSNKLREVADFKYIPSIMSKLSKNIFEKYNTTVSLAVGLRGEGNLTVYLAGNFYIYSKEGELIKESDSFSALGANMQKVSTRRSTLKRVMKLGPLPISVEQFNDAIYLSTSKIITSFPKKGITKTLVTSMKTDDNALVLIHV